MSTLEVSKLDQLMTNVSRITFSNYQMPLPFLDIDPSRKLRCPVSGCIYCCASTEERPVIQSSTFRGHLRDKFADKDFALARLRFIEQEICGARVQQPPVIRV